MITAEDLVRREVIYCVSSLVHTLAEGWGLTQFHEGDLGDLSEQALELSRPIEDWEEAATSIDFEERNLDGVPHWCHKDTPPENPYSCFYESAEDACEANDEPPVEWDVFEHWIVSDWLADKLEAKGERVDKDFAGMTVWGRTTTGQAIYMDSVIQEIYADLVADRG